MGAEAFTKPSSAGQRLADVYNLHGTAGAFGRWIAARLSDGGTDGTVYDTRADAVRHQLWPEYCGYAQIRPYPMSAGDGQDFLDFHRLAYDAGQRVTDPEVPQAIIPLEFNTRF
jgi:hypothetical protein